MFNVTEVFLSLTGCLLANQPLIGSYFFSMLVGEVSARTLSLNSIFVL